MPGHVIDSIFMGFYYGMAKQASGHGDIKWEKTYLRRAFWVPVLTHGFYDFCLFAGYDIFIVVFLVFVVVSTVIAIKKIREASRGDREIGHAGEPAAGDEPTGTVQK